MIEFAEVLSAYQTARRDLLAERSATGQWVGRLSSSALSTATAVSALSLAAAQIKDDRRRDAYRQLVQRSVQWLVGCQNEDGGWGDTDQSLSNIATTLLAQAAIHLAGAAAQHADRLRAAQDYVDAQGELAGLRARYGEDQTFAAPILTNAALAGLVPWSEVPPLPFELATLPHATLRLARLPVVSYAIPALVAIGQARFFHRWPRNPIVWLVRRLSVGRSLRRLAQMQPPSGGYLEAIPLTSFVVMSLASTGRTDHDVTRRGVAFLLDTVREDGSWPIDTNLATWNTTLSINALASASGDVGALGCLDWLLGCQHRKVHEFTQAEPGGWGWSDTGGAVPDADDTAGALLALGVLLSSGGTSQHGRIEQAVTAGVDWLLALQNGDGGWPTFCRGWGALPFDRSGTDLTAHAIRALAMWRNALPERKIDAAVRRGLEYLAEQQRADGSWRPLWFGNQHRPGEENPVYGTARVLLAYRDLGLICTEPAQQALRWLAQQLAQGTWGPKAQPQSYVEETALAVEALLADRSNLALQPALEEGIGGLVAAVREGRHRQASPIGLYFAKLWYYERVYPLVFTVSALGQAVRHLAPPAEPPRVEET